MAATPEKKVKTAIKSWLNARNIYHFSPIGGPFSAHGVPDIICCVAGRFVGIECKAPGREASTTANQNDHLARINRAGGVAVVASSLAEVVAVMRTLGVE